MLSSWNKLPLGRRWILPNCLPHKMLSDSTHSVCMLKFCSGSCWIYDASMLKNGVGSLTGLAFNLWRLISNLPQRNFCSTSDANARCPHQIHVVRTVVHAERMVCSVLQHAETVEEWTVQTKNMKQFFNQKKMKTVRGIYSTCSVKCEYKKSLHKKWRVIRSIFC